MITKAQGLLDRLLELKADDPAFDQKGITIKFTSETCDSVRGRVSVGDEFYPEEVNAQFSTSEIILTV